MPGKPLKTCTYPGCAILTRERRCEKHRSVEAIAYNRNTRDKDSRAFYSSAVWEKCREAILARDSYLCQQCLNAGVLTPATMVHHKVPLRTDWSKALDEDNLVSLCEACHGAAHRRGRRS